MFKCSECNQIYQNKPEYCDCGNDEFVEIKEQHTSTLKKLNSSLQIKNKMQIFSWGVFVTCILLSLIIWLFAWNDIPQKVEQKQTNEQTKIQKTPDIDEIWNDELPSSSVEQKKNEQNLLNPSKTAKTEKKVAVQQKNTKIKKTSTPKQPQQQTAKKESKTQKSENKVKQPKTQPQHTSNNQELTNYKVSLRSALFSHLKVTSVKGKGLCEVSFSIDKNGKLINRNFSKMSDNKTMNDAVYYMFMSLPQYLPPPKSYKGELLTMSFYINNGYYEINYKD